ncbi:alcohol dehydrogenase catalytic domain-containing protein [Micromonospora chersina]|uniref:alcohol dehydrogenase catalytic domain-containing protein n=1 Tax=Micromonospora chersina TaxID=47854 RepID=UPI0033E5FA11
MRAAYIERPGPVTEIRYGELPAPRPGPTDALVDVLATTVNPVDTFVRSGAYPTAMPLPFVVGRDLIGRVAETGSGVPGLRAGDLVWCNSLGYDGRPGAAAEQAVVPADRLYRLPDGVDPATAVTVLHPIATAYLALFVHGRLRSACPDGMDVYLDTSGRNTLEWIVDLLALRGADRADGRYPLPADAAGRVALPERPHDHRVRDLPRHRF